MGIFLKKMTVFVRVKGRGDFLGSWGGGLLKILISPQRPCMLPYRMKSSCFCTSHPSGLTGATSIVCSLHFSAFVVGHGVGQLGFWVQLRRLSLAGTSGRHSECQGPH